jgi:predicted transcriptional regulator
MMFFFTCCDRLPPSSVHQSNNSSYSLSILDQLYRKEHNMELDNKGKAVIKIINISKKILKDSLKTYNNTIYEYKT